MKRTLLALVIGCSIGTALAADDDRWIDTVGWTDGSGRVFQIKKDELINDRAHGIVVLWARFKNDPKDHREMRMVFNCTDPSYAIVEVIDPATKQHTKVDQPVWADIDSRQSVVGMVHSVVCEAQKPPRNSTAI